MELNSFLFPAPAPSYTVHAAIGDILFIPRNHNSASILQEQSQNIMDEQASVNKQSHHQHMQSQQLLKHKGTANVQASNYVPLGQSTCQSNVAKKPVTQQEEMKKHQLKHASSVQLPLLDSSKSLMDFTESFHQAANRKIPVPCLYLPNAQGSSKLLIYFHGNAEDVGLASELLDYIRSMMQVHILAVEYPGYGIYDGSPNAEQILEDAECVYDFLTKSQEPWAIPEESIILFGRSIGTGPATHLAAHRRPCALLLMSPFKSIREIVREQAGPLLQYVVSDRFRNIDNIQRVRCPTFLVHGQRDTLISFRHSQELHYSCGGPSALIMPRDMDHNEFDFIDDLIQPFHQFLRQCKIDLDPPEVQADLQRKPKKKKGSRRRNTRPPGLEGLEEEEYQFMIAEQRDDDQQQARNPVVQSEKVKMLARIDNDSDTDEQKEATDDDEKEEQAHNKTVESQIFKFPEELYTPPIDFPKINSNSNLWNWLLRKLM